MVLSEEMPAKVVLIFIFSMLIFGYIFFEIFDNWAEIPSKLVPSLTSTSALLISVVIRQIVWKKIKK